MKLVIALVLIAACGGSSKSPESPTTTTNDSPTTTTVDTTTPTNTTTTTSSPTTTTTTPATVTTTTTPTSKTTATPATTTRPAKALYSCFTYAQKGSTAKRTACMRTDECGPYLEQARQVGGIVADGGCASVDTLWCFHQAPSKTDPQGLDVCQPSLDACKSERALLVKKGTSVDTDCAQR